MVWENRFWRRCGWLGAGVLGPVLGLFPGPVLGGMGGIHGFPWEENTKQWQLKLVKNDNMNIEN